MGKSAFVTGATGFIGQNLLEVLHEAGWRVTALVRPGSRTGPATRLGAELVEGDVSDADSLARAMPEGLDCVFHVAASTSMWSRNDALLERVNVGGTRNVVEAALARGARRFVHTSSVAAYGLHDGRIDEDTPQLGASSWIGYFRTKALAEREVRAGIERGLDAVILNPVHVMGRYDRGNWSRLVLMGAQGRLPGVPPGSGSFCHGAEVARAHLAAAERGRSGANYLLGGVDATFQELVRTIGEVTGRRVPTRVTPAPLLRALGRMSQWWSYVSKREPDMTPEGVAIACAHIHGDSTRAERDLGYRAVPLRAIVEDCVTWLRAEGLLDRR